MLDDSLKEIKIILLGESGVGKTSLINVTTGGVFDHDIISSSSCSYKEGSYESKNGKKYFYHLWDTAGQEAYRSLNKIFVKNAKVVILVYSIESFESFKKLDYWINLVKAELGNSGYKMGIVGNKLDLYEKQKVKDEDAKNYANKMGYKFMTTSALEDPFGFKKFLEELLVDYIKTVDSSCTDVFGNFSFKIDKPNSSKDKKRNKKCCQ